MPPYHVVRLTVRQRIVCAEMLAADDVSNVVRRHAAILRYAASDSGGHATDREIAELAGVDPRTVARVRADFDLRGFEAALYGGPSSRSAPLKLTPEQEKHLLALAKTVPPPSHPRWSYRSLAEQFSRMEGMPPVSRELVRRTLKRHNHPIQWSYPLRGWGPDAIEPPEP